METPEVVERKLFKLREEVEFLIEDNFGYCPDSKYFNKVFQDMQSVEEQLKQIAPDKFETYCNQYY